VSSSQQEIKTEVKPILEYVSGKYGYEFRPKEEESVADKALERIDPKEISHESLLGKLLTLQLLVLVTDGSEEATKATLDKLISQIRDGSLTLTEVRNYYGVKPENNNASIPPPPLSLRSIMRPEPHNILRKFLHIYQKIIARLLEKLKKLLLLCIIKCQMSMFLKVQERNQADLPL